MPAGFTHLACARKTLDYLQNADLADVRNILESNIGFFLLGCIAPDLPYLGALGGQFFSTKSLADSLHYKNTNKLPLKGLEDARQEFQKNNVDLAHALFAFYMGYTSHLIADGIIHPFVRDMVGDYDVASKEHRILEMRLDVLVVYELFGIGVNGASLQEDLDYINDSHQKKAVLSHFAELIREVHHHDLDTDDIEQFISGFGNAMDLAEGKFLDWYQDFFSNKGFAYADVPKVLARKEKDTILTFPIDAEEKGNIQNFLKQDRVNFFENVVPHYFKVFPNIISSAHQYLTGTDIQLSALIPEINLDTGRLVANNELSETPILWTV